MNRHTMNAFVNGVTGRRADFAQLFMTHPPDGQRVARLLVAERAR